MLEKARTGLGTFFADYDQENMDKLNQDALSAQAALFADDAKLLKAQVKANEGKIKSYKDQISKLEPPETAQNLQDSFAISANIPPAPPDIVKPTASSPVNYWTTIQVAVSASYSAEQSSSSSNSYSVGGSASWGLWSVGGSVSHSDATADAAKQMANSNIKISFECLRVDITRSWLRGELFYDDDLMLTPGNS